MEIAMTTYMILGIDTTEHCVFQVVDIFCLGLDQ